MPWVSGRGTLRPGVGRLAELYVPEAIEVRLNAALRNPTVLLTANRLFKRFAPLGIDHRVGVWVRKSLF